MLKILLVKKLNGLLVDFCRIRIAYIVNFVLCFFFFFFFFFVFFFFFLFLFFFFCFFFFLKIKIVKMGINKY